MIQRSSSTTVRRALVAPLSVLLVLLLASLLSACGEGPVTAGPSGEELTVARPQNLAAPGPTSSGNLSSTAHEAANHSDRDVDAHAQHDVDAHSEDDPHADHDAPGAHGGHDGHQHAEPLAAAPLPGTSLFHLTTEFTDQHGQALALGDLRGAPSVVVMFYGDCDTACPLLVRSAEEIERALPPELRSSTNFVMVTFDTARDTPERLLAYAQDKDLDRDGWHWLVGTQFQTRQLATLLGVQYRDAGNGVFAHSNLVTVLDAEGVPIARLEGLGVALEPAVAAVRTGVSPR